MRAGVHLQPELHEHVLDMRAHYDMLVQRELREHEARLLAPRRVPASLLVGDGDDDDRNSSSNSNGRGSSGAPPVHESRLLADLARTLKRARDEGGLAIHKYVLGG
jgi:hypothetical protein